MIEIGIIEEALECKVDAAFITGSYVNGYYREDSDIDIVVVTDDYPLKSLPPMGNISLHIVSSNLLSLFSVGRYYLTLSVLPIKNEDSVKDISDTIKMEVVRRQAKKLQKKNISFSPEDFAISHLKWRWCIEEPWRYKPLQRMLSSDTSHKILHAAYLPICQNYAQNGLLEEADGKYIISDTARFNNDSLEWGFLSKAAWTLRQSKCGYYYLRYLPQIIKTAFARP